MSNHATDLLYSRIYVGWKQTLKHTLKCCYESLRVQDDDACHTNVLCDWLNYFPFPVVRTHVKVSNKAIKHLQFAKYYQYDLFISRYGQPGSDSWPSASAVHRNRVSETKISAAGASNDGGLLGKISVKLPAQLCHLLCVEIYLFFWLMAGVSYIIHNFRLPFVLAVDRKLY